MTNEELHIGLRDFCRYPSLAYNLSEGESFVNLTVKYSNQAVNSLSPYGDFGYWVAPSDIQNELNLYAPEGTYDSVLVMVPHFGKPEGGTPIPTTGWWGLGYPCWPCGFNGSTYAVCINYSGFIEEMTKHSGELWLHEWLHNTSGFYRYKGYSLPEKDADGGEFHGYTCDPEWGWSQYYGDLMTGRVWDAPQGKWTGITPEAWQSGAILDRSAVVFADYFRNDTISEYRKTGTSEWSYIQESITLGYFGSEKSSAIYIDSPICDKFALTGRVLIPENAGNYDSISLAIKGQTAEYWGILMYGNALTQKNSIGISKDDVGVDFYPLNLINGWYTIKMDFDKPQKLLSLKVWPEESNEPSDWQIQTTVSEDWLPTEIGFRYYGGFTQTVDDLVFVGE